MSNYKYPSKPSPNLNQNQGAYHPAYGKKGPIVIWDSKSNKIILKGKIVLYGTNSNIDVAEDHFIKAIQAWNHPEIPIPLQRQYEGDPRGTINYGGRQVPVEFDIKVIKSTPTKVEQALQNPEPDTVYILVSPDAQNNYQNSRQIRRRANILNNVNPNYLQTLVNDPRANVGNLVLRMIFAAMRGQPSTLPTSSFLIGNVGYYDLPTSQTKGNSSAAHELGHWLSHQILINGNWNSHVPLPSPSLPNNTPQNVPIETFRANRNSSSFMQNHRRSIMSFGLWPQNRTPLVTDTQNIGYGQNFNIYQNTQNRPTGAYLGDRGANGQLILFNQNTMFKTPLEAALFQSLFSNIPDWNPNVLPNPQ